MRIGIVFNAPGLNAGAAETDVLDQVQAVEAALTQGANVLIRLPCTLDLNRLDESLTHARPDVVVNLVEALGGTDRLATLVPMLLEARGIRYTGVGASALLSCVDKIAAKARLRQAGIATPDWRAFGSGEGGLEGGHVILKARFEHASLGMDDSAVLCASTGEDTDQAIGERQRRHHTPFYAERFIAGREFNLALLQCDEDADDGSGVQVLPVAEIDFSAFPPDKPRIVGYAAKWRTDSFEYGATPRRFDFATDDRGLVRELRRTAVAVWHLFGLRGYARVDFRVDEHGVPYVLEVNANPCLAPDAGFAAALERADVDFPSAMRRLLRLAVAE